MKNIAIGYLDSNIGGVNKHIVTVVNTIRDKFDKIILLSTGQLAKPYMEMLSEIDNVVIEIIPTSSHIISNYKCIKKILKENNIKVFYNNLSTNIPCFGLIAAKKLKISRRITHSHSSGLDIKNSFKRMVYYLINLLFRIVVNYYTTDFLACSEMAANWLFGRKDYVFIPNAVDKKRFTDVKVDCSLKTSLRIKDNKYIIGFIGRFSYQKNIDFIFELIKKMDKQRYHFLLIGDGPEISKINFLIREMNYDNITLLSSQSDIEIYYKLMDVFILPSRFEGLPIVGVEAQMALTKCIFSSKITKQSSISNVCEFLPIKPLSKSLVLWEKSIKNLVSIKVDVTVSNFMFEMEYFSKLINSVLLDEGEKRD